MRKFISIMAIAALVLGSCQEKNELDGPVVETGEIALSGDSLNEGMISAGPEGGEFSVKVTSTGDWRVSGISEWVAPVADSGKNGDMLTFKVEPNETMEAKEASFKVFCADAVQTVKIVSNPVYDLILMSEDSLVFGSGAYSFAVNLVSNVKDINIDFGGAEDWVKFKTADDVFGKKILQFEVLRSQEFKEREAEITLGSDVTENTAVINIMQAQRDTVFVEGEQRIIRGLDALQEEVVIKSNVDFTYTLPSWLTDSSVTTSEMDEATGLKTTTLTLSAEACGGSRAATVEFEKSNGLTVGYMYVKQQNPNPVFANISDKSLRNELSNMGWILVEPGSTECEVLEAGLTATSLDLSYNYDVLVVDGLGAFPELADVNLNNAFYVESIDVSDCTKLTNLSISATNALSYINLGAAPIKSLKSATSVSTTYNYSEAESITIISEHLEDLNYASSSYYIMYYEYLKTMDVSECPALKNLNVRREYYGSAGPLETVYISAAQQSAIEAGTLTVDKVDAVQLVVK